MNLATDDAEYEAKKEKLERSISKCRDAITVMEAKLKKVLDRVKGASPRKPRTLSRDQNMSNISLLEESKISEGRTILDESTSSVSTSLKDKENHNTTPSSKVKLRKRSSKVTERVAEQQV